MMRRALLILLTIGLVSGCVRKGRKDEVRPDPNVWGLLACGAMAGGSGYLIGDGIRSFGKASSLEDEREWLREKKPWIDPPSQEEIQSNRSLGIVKLAGAVLLAVGGLVACEAAVPD